MNGNKEARLDDVQQGLLLFLTGVSGDVNGHHGMVDDVRAPLEEPIDDGVDHLLVPGNGVGGEHHRIAPRQPE